MYSAFAVANTALSASALSLPELQHVLLLAQLRYKARKNTPLFDDFFVVGTEDLYVPSIHHKLKMLGSRKLSGLKIPVTPLDSNRRVSPFIPSDDEEAMAAVFYGLGLQAEKGSELRALHARLHTESPGSTLELDSALHVVLGR